MTSAVRGLDDDTDHSLYRLSLLEPVHTIPVGVGRKRRTSQLFSVASTHLEIQKQVRNIAKYGLKIRVGNLCARAWSLFELLQNTRLKPSNTVKLPPLLFQDLLLHRGPEAVFQIGRLYGIHDDISFRFT